MPVGALIGPFMLAPTDPRFRDEWLASLDPDGVVSKRTLKRFKRYYKHGCFAGELLCGSVQYYVTHGAERFALKNVKLDIYSRRFGCPSHNISKGTLEALWSKYKPVSHLWAALLYLGLNDAAKPISFPCRSDQIEDFLAMAEFFARMGSSIRMPQRGDETILSTEDLALLIRLGASMSAYEFTSGPLKKG